MLKFDKLVTLNVVAQIAMVVIDHFTSLPWFAPAFGTGIPFVLGLWYGMKFANSFKTAATTAFRQLDDRLPEAARSLGCSPRGAFWRVALPVAAPGLAAGQELRARHRARCDALWCVAPDAIRYRGEPDGGDGAAPARRECIWRR